MDPISLAILTAIAAGIASGAPKVIDQALTDAYNGFKELIKRKYGAESQVAKAIQSLEERPESENRKGVVKEEVTAVKADKDPELVKAAQALMAKLKANPVTAGISQSIIGDNNVQISGTGNAVNYNTPSKS